jgi:rRNA maturation RNase YbeY
MQNIIEMLKLNVPMAMKIALDGLLEYNYKTRDTSISDIGKYEKVEVSVLLCNDNFIRNLNKECRGEDSATDMLSVSQYISNLDVPTVRTKQHLNYFQFLPLTLPSCSLSDSHTLFVMLQLMLGDIVISVETAARQAEERGHTLLDELRALVVCSSIF